MHHPCLLVLASLLLCACSEISPTLDFHRVETEFDQAFDTDRLYTGRISAAPSGYSNVIRSLPQSGIAKLDAQSHATAWMMRAIAEWRTGSFASANASAASGLAAAPRPHSREQVLLTMIPALVIDSQNITAWKAAGMACTAEQYAGMETSYLSALKTLDAALAVMDSSTPESVRHYHAYQKWRVLFNWETIIDNLSGGRAMADEVILKIRPRLDGHDLLDLADAVRQTVPAGNPYRVIMDAEMGSQL